MIVKLLSLGSVRLKCKIRDIYFGILVQKTTEAFLQSRKNETILFLFSFNLLSCATVVAAQV